LASRLYSMWRELCWARDGRWRERDDAIKNVVKDLRAATTIVF
jgi:hypothetical protein